MQSARAASDAESAGPVHRAWRVLLGGPEAAARQRFAIAVALALLGLLADLLLRDALQGYVLLVYCGAVGLAAVRGGTAPGLACLALCAAAFGVLQHVAPPTRPGAGALPPLLLFAGFAGLGLWAGSAVREGYVHVAARRRRAERRADVHRALAELGVRALGESDLAAIRAEALAAARRALACDGVALLELLPGGDRVVLSEVDGPDGARRGEVFGPAEAPLAFRALAERAPLAVEDLREQPALGSALAAAAGVVSAVVAPVVAPGPGGRSSGVMAAYARTRREFGPDEVSFLLSAANVLATAVVRLRAEEQVRRTLASERYLADASRQLAASMDWNETVARVAELAVPFLGDWCVVTLPGEGGRLRSAAGATHDPALAPLLAELRRSYEIDPDAAHGAARAVRTGEAELLAETSPDAFVPEAGEAAARRRAVLRALGLGSFMGAPMIAAGRTLGALAFGLGEGTRRFDEEDLRIAQAFAGRCAVALEQAELFRAAQAATRVREEMLSVVSHDLKTPLNALLVGARLVERLAPATVDADDLRRAAVTLRRTAERMARLVHDLVDVASMDAGGVSVQLADQEAVAIGREAIEAMRAMAAEREVSLALEAPAPVPLRCDRDRLLQVLSNLLSNAIQVTPPGGRVVVRAFAGGDGEALLSVVDDGPGIPGEELPHLFERWYRGRRARYPGSGLGLAIAHAIVAAHQGRIWAESLEGRGSTFSVALPRERPPGQDRQAGGAAVG